MCNGTQRNVLNFLLPYKAPGKECCDSAGVNIGVKLLFQIPLASNHKGFLTPPMFVIVVDIVSSTCTLVTGLKPFTVA